MSDSDVEVISNPSRPRAIFDDSQDDELIRIEIATSSPPARRRTPAVLVDDDDDDDDNEDYDQEEADEEEESLFVSQDSSPASEGDGREAGSSLPGVDANPRERSMMERRGQLFTQRGSAAVPRPRQPAEAFIDLTQEPDSPDYSRLAMPAMGLPRNDRPRNAGFLDQSSGRGEQRGQNARAASRNPRRQAGLVRTPSLARSDASINGGRGRAGGGGIPLIDLTDDGPEPVAPPQPPPPAEANAAANNPWNWFTHPPRPAARGDAQLPFGRALNQHIRGHINQLTNQLTAVMRDNGGIAPADAAVADQPNLPDVIRIIHLDLDYNGGVPPDFWDPHVHPDAEKPKYDAPKEAMEGCTRSTGEDVVAICPSCEEELVYDPDEKPATPPPAKRQRTKKDRAEHHFMAVKACGHVFCHQCYDSRKEKAKNNKLSDPGCGFRPGPNRSVMCAVEGCDSEVGSKTAWLGIFV